MQKIFIAVAGLLASGVITVMLKTGNVPPPQTSAPASIETVAIDNYLLKNPSATAAPQLRRLTAAVKARPSVQAKILVEAASRSVEDGVISAREAAMLQDAASLSERQDVSEQEMTDFSNKYSETASPQETASLQETATPQGTASPGSHAALAIDHYVTQHPAGIAAKSLGRLSAALKSRPSAHTQVLAEAANRSLEDGKISTREAKMLEEAAALAERDEVSEQQIQKFSKKDPAAATPQATAAAARGTVSKIDNFLARHPAGTAAKPLRRLSKAIKARPSQPKVLTDAVARSVEDGSISKEEETMLEEAATLAEREGWSPREMAEFSRKYEGGIGSHKPVVGKFTAAPRAPLPSFSGKRHLIYTFEGTAQCPPNPCADIRVSVRVSSGKWMETREGTTDGKGHYVFRMPVLSKPPEAVTWRLEANTKDLRQTVLTGQRVTTDADRDITLQNNLVLNPS